MYVSLIPLFLLRARRIPSPSTPAAVAAAAALLPTAGRRPPLSGPPMPLPLPHSTQRPPSLDSPRPTHLLRMFRGPRFQRPPASLHRPSTALCTAFEVSSSSGRTEFEPGLIPVRALAELVPPICASSQSAIASNLYTVAAEAEAEAETAETETETAAAEAEVEAISLAEEDEEEEYGEEEYEKDLLDERRPEIALADYQHYWTHQWHDFGSRSLDNVTAICPMRFTDEAPSRWAACKEAVQMFSVRVIEVLRGLEWPLDVYGFIAVRDCVDESRNLIFERSRYACQTLTAEDSHLMLTGPTRGVVALDAVQFEVDLRVKCRRPSEDKVLSAQAFEYVCIGRRAGFVRTKTKVDKCSTLEFKFAHLARSVEATVKVCLLGRPIDLRGQFSARNSSFPDEKVVLLDSRNGTVAIDSHSGAITFSRTVVVVSLEENLQLDVEAFQGNHMTNVGEATAVITPRINSRSYDHFDVGFCKMSIEVVWSQLDIW